MRAATKWSVRENEALTLAWERGDPLSVVQAAMPGRTMASIRSHVAALGLPYRRKPIRPRSAKRSGGAAPPLVEDAAHAIAATVSTDSAPVPVLRMRTCLCCRRQFESEHAGNRMCGGCRRKSADTSYMFLR